jgi:hypothetical protein
MLLFRLCISTVREVVVIARHRLLLASALAGVGIASFAVACGSNSSTGRTFFPAIRVQRVFVASGGTITVATSHPVDATNGPRFRQFDDLNHQIRILVMPKGVETASVHMTIAGFGPKPSRRDRDNIIAIYRDSTTNQALIHRFTESLKALER